jgi:hypothetical protein
MMDPAQKINSLEARLHKVEKLAAENKTSIRIINASTKTKLADLNTKVADLHDGYQVEKQKQEALNIKLLSTLCSLRSKVEELQEDFKDCTGNDEEGIEKLKLELLQHMEHYEKMRKELRERFGTLGAI